MENINKSFYEKIIDLRDSRQFVKNHINGSINIAYYNLLIDPDKYLEKNKRYLLVCDHGIMSKKISAILNKKGFLTNSLTSGIKEYQRFDKNCKKK